MVDFISRENELPLNADYSDIRSTRLSETISKNNVLIEEKKYYEFAQKIKSAADRKLQAKKTSEAAALFSIGADKLLSIEEVEENIPLELIDNLAKIYGK
jgi:hypothetical protein